jgi:hypothetical protein
LRSCKLIHACNHLLLPRSRQKEEEKTKQLLFVPLFIYFFFYTLITIATNMMEGWRQHEARFRLLLADLGWTRQDLFPSVTTPDHYADDYCSPPFFFSFAGKGEQQRA